MKMAVGGAAGGAPPHQRAGAVIRVNGPLVEVEGVDGISMLELVALGPERITAATVAIRGARATLQAYEYTGGLRVGDRAEATGQQLSGLFGPGLLGQVFDGLMRPLSSAATWLTPDRAPATEDPQTLARVWRFVPSAPIGAHVSPGDVLGTVPDAGSVEHRVLVPWDATGGLTWISPEGEMRVADVVARIGDRAVRLGEPWPVRVPRPFRNRPAGAVPLHTGQRVLDLLYPVARGAAAAVPGGFGTGKTVLLQQIAKWSDADVIVYVGCGERGNEMADVLDGLSQLVDARTGGRLIDRTVIIANTSNMPMMAREASIYTGVSVADFYRDMGYDVVVIADSTSRWAEALREFANRNGDLPAEDGYPADLASELAAFYERAGRVTTLGGAEASVTVIGAVSPPGGDLTEPVTTDTQRFIRSLWLLDRDLAYSRHYPAVSWTGSFARDTVALGSWHVANGDAGWPARRARATALLAEADRLGALAEIVGPSSLPGHERMVLLGGRLLRDGVLMQNALSDNDGFCSAAKGAALLDMVLAVVDACEHLIESGVAATTIEQADHGLVLRAREETGPDDADAVRERALEALRLLEELR
ncbi:MAG TPA: V-type ATP synthase subunit A [Cellulomonadaceae bacterium]|nr:V-type ATP synthase subunit A [Cellulomonadaceae bacterium]